MQLAWVKFRSGSTVHCRLGGTAITNSLGDVILSSPENGQVIATVLGKSAPQPPVKSNPYAPGCVVGNANFQVAQSPLAAAFFSAGFESFLPPPTCSPPDEPPSPSFFAVFPLP